MPGPTLFISPHFDDVALSCGGVVALTSDAVIVTVFAGQPGALLTAFARFQHDRWRTGERAVDARQTEELRALELLGARHHWLDFPDAIYRGDLYLSDEDLFGPVKPADRQTETSVVAAIVGLARETGSTTVYLPLGVGGHVDHRVCRRAARPILDLGIGVRFFEDFPYAIEPGAVERAVAESPFDLVPTVVDVASVIDRQIAAIAAYPSQLPTIFRHYGPWEAAVRAYRSTVAAGNGYAERVWTPTASKGSVNHSVSDV